MAENNESYREIYEQIVSAGLKDEFKRERTKLIFWTYHLEEIAKNSGNEAAEEVFTEKEEELAKLDNELIKKGISFHFKNFENLHRNYHPRLNSFFLNKTQVYAFNYPIREFSPVLIESNSLCFINNNFIFEKEETRNGSDKEADKLENIFKLFNYIVTRENDLNRKNFIDKIKKMTSSKDLANYVSFIGFFMSHGNKKYFQCSDGGIKYEHIIHMFNNEHCPYLKGKPKVLFFICCRGKKKDKGSKIEFDEPKNEEISKKIPLQSDMLIVYSTYDGYVSPRDTQNGSLFGNCLIEVLEDLIENPFMVKEINDILKETSAKLIQNTYNLKEQKNLIPSFEFKNRAFNKNYYLGLHVHY